MGFEKRIAQIYNNCRTEEEIQTAFDLLQKELEDSIKQRLEQTHQQLMENFDEEVLEKIKVESQKRLDVFEEKFSQFSRFVLADYADKFDNENCSFRLNQSPTPSVTEGVFRFLSHRLPFDRLPKDAQVYRIGHPLSQFFIHQAKEQTLPVAKLVFDYDATPNKITALEKLRNTEGWLRLEKLDRWADDQRLALHTELRELEQEIRLRRNLARQMTSLAERIKEQRAVTDLEKKLADKRLHLHAEEDNIESRKNVFLDDIEKKISTHIEQTTLFAIRWKIV